jgi:hypothetical protein
MNNLKRFTVCKLANHKWAKVAYQPLESGTGYFIRCLRCGKEMHDVGRPGVRFPGAVPPD